MSATDNTRSTGKHGRIAGKEEPGLHEEPSLPRERPDDARIAWSKLPLGPRAAQSLMFENFTEREELLLSTLARRRYLTTEQVARAFYDSYQWAADRLSHLYMQRFVARLDLSPAVRARMLGRKRHRPPHVYLLDWNGKYYLDKADPASVRLWDPRWIALPGATTLHRLGVNEVWSLLLAAARRTQHDTTSSGACLSLGWRDEVEAHVAIGGRKSEVLRPDADLLLRISTPQAGCTSDGSGTRPALDQSTPDWRLAELDYWPAPAEMSRLEEDGAAMYRQVLLEYESGANTDNNYLVEKVQRYNRLYALDATWRQRYGRFPRVLVVTAEARQREAQVRIWRQHYAIRPRPGSALCPVLIACAADIAAAAQEDAAGLLGPCWINAMHPDGPRQVSLGEALGVDAPTAQAHTT